VHRHEEEGEKRQACQACIEGEGDGSPQDPHAMPERRSGGEYGEPGGEADAGEGGERVAFPPHEPGEEEEEKHEEVRPGRQGGGRGWRKR